MCKGVCLLLRPDQEECVCAHLCVCVCVFLPSLKCALGLCVSMHMNVFPLCGCLLFLAEQSEMSKADKFQKDEEKAEIECARTNSAMLF